MPARSLTSSNRERNAPSISLSEQDGTHFLNSLSGKYLLIVYRFFESTYLYYLCHCSNLPSYTTIDYFSEHDDYPHKQVSQPSTNGDNKVAIAHANTLRSFIFYKLEPSILTQAEPFHTIILLIVVSK